MSTDFRETLYTIDKRGNRKWLYPALEKGKFFRLRSVVVYALMAFYLVMPWITINGEQGILFDIPARRFIIFGQVFWATDTSFLVLVLAGLAITLFLVTSVAGRLWCGWACPETVFLEFLFRPIERLIEGGPAARLKLDQGPWNARKIRLKATKHFLFALCAWILASTFLAYFVGREPLIRMMSGSPMAHPFEFGVTVFFMALMAFQFGWFREQFCTVVCPYARFQSVLLDSDSLVVGYDARRGEPRGKLQRGEIAPGEQRHGDCIDCKRCVRVCPTGIDIRNGLQLECIHCAACVDACDSVMAQIGREPGLIRYSTENELAGHATRRFRPRVAIYTFILLAIVSTFAYRLSTRQFIDVQFLRGNHAAPFTLLEDGRVSNHLSAHIGNKDRKAQQIWFDLVSPEGVKLLTPLVPFPIAAESIATAPVFFQAPRELLQNGKLRVKVKTRNNEGFEKVQEVTILGPDK